MSPFTKDKWGEAIKSEIIGLFDNDTFILNEKPLPADEIFPAKLACKTKLNIYGGLHELKATICLRGDMQIKEDFISCSPTASTRLLKCFIADAAKNKSKIYQWTSYRLSFRPRLLKECLSSWTKNSLTFVLNCPNIIW